MLLNLGLTDLPFVGDIWPEKQERSHLDFQHSTLDTRRWFLFASFFVQYCSGSYGTIFSEPGNLVNVNVLCI